MLKSDEEEDDKQKCSRRNQELVSDDEEPSHVAVGMSDGDGEVIDEIEELSWP